MFMLLYGIHSTIYQAKTVESSPPGTEPSLLQYEYEYLWHSFRHNNKVKKDYNIYTVNLVTANFSLIEYFPPGHRRQMIMCTSFDNQQLTLSPAFLSVPIALPQGS